MKGREAGPDETKESCPVVVLDAARQEATARAGRWNTARAESEKNPVIRWGDSKTVSLAGR